MAAAPRYPYGGVTGRTAASPPHYPYGGVTGRTEPLRRRKDPMATMAAQRAALLKQIAAAAGAGGGTPAAIASQSLAQFPSGPTARPRIRVPTAPTPGNPYAGVAQAVRGYAAQSAARQRAGNKGVPTSDILSRSGAGTFAEQAAGQLAESASAATQLEDQLRGKYAMAELQRQAASSRARYDQQIAQLKANQGQAAAQLSFSMVQQLAAQNIDPTPFLNNPIAAAVTLGRIRYARQGETALTGPQLAMFAQYGVDPTSYPTMQAAWQALGEARREQALGGGSLADVLGIARQLGIDPGKLYGG